MRWLWRAPEYLEMVAVGAHMSGLPLNHQLISLGAKLVKQCRTAPVYKLYSLGPRPALVRIAAEAGSGLGHAYEVEVWAVPINNVGKFLRDGVKPPLCIGDVLLEDGSQVKGFLGEAYAVQEKGIEDVSNFSGWRAYLASKQAS